MELNTHRMETPIFEWPEFDRETKESEMCVDQYPFTKSITHVFIPGKRFSSTQTLGSLCKRVAKCIDLIDPNVGDIAGLVAKDLARTACDKERALLPREDWIFPYFEISEECKRMLEEKICKAQQKHAHDLAVNSSVDILITWDCEKLTPGAAGKDYFWKRVVYIQEADARALKQAGEGEYKLLDWDKMHFDPTDVKPLSRHPALAHWLGEKYLSSRSLHLPSEPPSRKGGFYTCVRSELHAQLLCMAQSERRKIQVTTIVEPKFMSKSEMEESEEYYATRKRTDVEKPTVAFKPYAEVSVGRRQDLFPPNKIWLF